MSQTDAATALRELLDALDAYAVQMSLKNTIRQWGDAWPVAALSENISADALAIYPEYRLAAERLANAIAAAEAVAPPAPAPAPPPGEPR